MSPAGFPVGSGTSPEAEAPQHGGTFTECLGMMIEEVSEAGVRLTLPIESCHLNRAGTVHGGVLSTLLDQACGLGGLGHIPNAERSCRTLALNCTFLEPGVGPVLTAVGRRTGGGRSVFFSTAEVTNPDGRVVATGSAVFRLVVVAPTGQASGSRR